MLRCTQNEMPPTASPLLPRLGGRGRGSRKRPKRAPANFLISFKKSGAGEGIRTLDPNLGKVVLYP
jgi:hypothetical protein